MSIFRDMIEFSRGIRIRYQVREQATPSTSRGIIPTALAKAFCGQKPTPTLPSFIFSNRFIIEEAMSNWPDSGKRLSHQNLAKFALCRKILRRQDNYPPRWFKRHIGQKSPLVSEDWQADFQWKIDALLMLWPSEKGRIYAYWATYYHQFQNRGTTFFRHKKSP